MTVRRSPVAPPPPTSLVWSRLGGELEVVGASRPWPEGERRQLTGTSPAGMPRRNGVGHF